MTADVEPEVRVVRGRPTPEEMAALVAVIRAKAATVATAAATGTAARPSTWAAYWRVANAPRPSGPGAWRASALPR